MTWHINIGFNGMASYLSSDLMWTCIGHQCCKIIFGIMNIETCHMSHCIIAVLIDFWFSKSYCLSASVMYGKDAL